ncbi:MAG: DUF2188 domain-containing protein [Gammaproteobacteria bacterium]
MAKRDIHVVPREDRWAKIKEGGQRPSSVHSTKAEALQRAREQAKREHVEVVIHKKDGTIQDSDSYGKAPNPPKDKKH